MFQEWPYSDSPLRNKPQFNYILEWLEIDQIFLSVNSGLEQRYKEVLQYDLRDLSKSKGVDLAFPELTKLNIPYQKLF